MRAQSRALSGSPVGQIVGSVDRVRAAKDVVFQIVEEWIEATQRMSSVIAE
jgi:NAD(P)H-dependent flavin oxidoreductase YrpB (nitropropane dioxygenase family)